MDTRKFSRFTPGVTPGQPYATPPQDLPSIGTVTKVTATGVWFTVPWTPQHEYGPAPWGLGQYASVAAAVTAGYQPRVGDRALIVFAGAGYGNPWVLSWTR